jgi:hypothetical protein
MGGIPIATAATQCALNRGALMPRQLMDKIYIKNIVYIKYNI